MITIIVAKAENNVIGNENQLIWHLSSDLKRFKSLTSGHPILMGRKTYESIGKPLPNRTNIVITRNEEWKEVGVFTSNSLEEAIKKAKEFDDEIFILGGGNIYKQSMKFADFLEITEVHQEFEGDTRFPEIDEKIWKEVSRERFEKDEKNEFDYSFVRYERRN
ncbi:dihydrofolate reductase [Moheibacter lacus]|uniref:Dihydrofolate reductase n=1 Tax=Moheibacter lacus TaxID=2745851 RepID=A0A838ZLL3_9FLAO|nr:dihydrofolate reductase [Moheibacter lacus]MBA5629374.1 dihydrofolate reductase [Moheibacter lacus]